MYLAQCNFYATHIFNRHFVCFASPSLALSHSVPVSLYLVYMRALRCNHRHILCDSLSILSSFSLFCCCFFSLFAILLSCAAVLARKNRQIDLNIFGLRLLFQRSMCIDVIAFVVAAFFFCSAVVVITIAVAVAVVVFNGNLIR